MEPPRISVVIPAFNEQGRLPHTLQKITAYFERRGAPFEIVVVDDGSTDATAELAAACPRVRLLLQPRNLGKGAAVRRGMLAARGERVLFSDADLSTPIEELAPLEQALEHGADVAIGSRAVDPSRVELRQSAARELAGRLFNLVVQALAVPGIRDSQCGFKLFRRKAVEPIFGRSRIDGFGFDVEALVLARHHGFTISEIPVRWINSPDSRVGLGQGAAAFLDPLRVRVGLWLGLYDTGRAATSDASHA